MNNSAAVMLFEENGVRPVKVEYDPSNEYNNKGAQHTFFFKCVDESVVKGDLVNVQTTTRHGFTVAKVVSIGFADVPVDFDNPSINWLWIVGKLDQTAIEGVLEGEKKMVGMVAEAHANKMRADLQASMGLGKLKLQDVFLKAPAQIASPHGQVPASASNTPIQPASSGRRTYSEDITEDPGF